MMLKGMSPGAAMEAEAEAAAAAGPPALLLLRSGSSWSPSASAAAAAAAARRSLLLPLPATPLTGRCCVGVVWMDHRSSRVRSDFSIFCK